MTSNGHGADRPELPDLPRITERVSFLYLEKCNISRDDSGVIAVSESGVLHIPIASIGAILLGPGTTVTHRAMELTGDTSTSICWVASDSAKMYCFGRPLNHSSALIELQAALVSNRRRRLEVAREMYQMRFPNEDVSHLTMQQLRGREGSRIRGVYRNESKRTGVEWNGRAYRVDDFSVSDDVNASLSIANSILYGVIHSVVCSLGCSPALGFVHTGHDRSFVYDVADLYKTETAIPVAFDVAASHPANIWSATRSRMREAIHHAHIMERAVHDIQHLLRYSVPENDDVDEVRLWGDNGESVPGGVSYKEDRI